MKSKTKTISKGELARLLKVTPARISQLIAAGMPVLADGRIDRTKAVEWHTKNKANHGLKPGPKRERKAVPVSDSADTSALLQARGRKESALADLRELDAKKRRGELLEAADVERSWAGMISAARSALLLAPAKLAPRLAPISDPRECEVIIDKEIRAVLTGLSEYTPEDESHNQPKGKRKL